MLVLRQMTVFLLLMLAGWIAAKRGIMTPDNQRQFSALAVDIACPAMILSAAGAEPAGLEDMITALMVVFLVFAVTILLAKVLPAALRYPKRDRPVVEVMTVFTNMGFIGMPLLAGIYGEKSLIYITLFMIVSNVVYFSYGINTVSGHSGHGLAALRGLLNAGIGACAVTIFLYLTEMKLPEILWEAVGLLGSMTAPLAMMLLGAALPQTDWRRLLSDSRLLLFTLLRFILFPVAVLWGLKLFIDNEMLLGAALVVLATPVGAMVPMLAAIYDPEGYPLAAGATSFTTAASVVTLPIVSLLTGLG